MEANNITDYYDDGTFSMYITNEGNGSTYTFISAEGNVTLDSDKSVLNISVSGKDTTSDNFISKEEAINIVKPDAIEEVKKQYPDLVSRITFSATGPKIYGRDSIYEYEVDTLIDGNIFMETWVDARTGENYGSVGAYASSGIREDGTYGPLTNEEYHKYHNITINYAGSFEEDESIENGT